MIATTALVAGAAATFASHEGGVPSSRIRPGYAPKHVRATFSVGRTTNRGVIHNTTSQWTPGAIFQQYSARIRTPNFSPGTALQLSIQNTVTISRRTHGTSSAKLALTRPIHRKRKGPENDDLCWRRISELFNRGVRRRDPERHCGRVARQCDCDDIGDDVQRRLALLPVGENREIPSCACAEQRQKVLAGVECANSPCYGAWSMEDVDFSGAAVDYWHIFERALPLPPHPHLLTLLLFVAVASSDIRAYRRRGDYQIGRRTRSQSGRARVSRADRSGRHL